MSSILIKNADYIVTMDEKRRILRNASLYIEGPEIKEVDSQRKKADKIINASRMIVLPGFINCHHHMFQSLFRNIPGQQNQTIDKWIQITANIASQITPEMIYFSSLTNMAELLLSGCTSTADFLYVYPNNIKGLFESTIKAAQDIGIRFHPYRGSMSIGKSRKGLFPDKLVQETNEIIHDTEKIIKIFHDYRKFSMLKIGIGPCTLFSSSRKDYIESAKLANKYNLNIQTHLCESSYEIDFCKKKFGKLPLDYLRNLGWKGRNVSFVHGIYLNKSDINNLAFDGSSICHCPISNSRKPTSEKLAIAPISEMLNKGITVGIGVDGSAGNDSSNILEEMRWARTIQGLREKFTYLKPTEVLEMGTLGGAKLFNRNDIGSLEVGKAADIAIFNPSIEISQAGATADPIGSLIASEPIKAEFTIVNGKIVVSRKKLLTVRINKIINEQNKNSRKIIQNAGKEIGQSIIKVIWKRAIIN